MKPNLDEVNEKFIAEYESALTRAVSLFQERKSEGRNGHMPPVGMFCFGVESAITLIWMKACRLVGDAKATNTAKIEEECEDIINYAAMAIAYLRVTEPGEVLESAKYSKDVQPVVDQEWKTVKRGK